MLEPVVEEARKFSNYDDLKDYVEDDSQFTHVHKLNYTFGDKFYMHDDKQLIHKKTNSTGWDTYNYTPSALKKLFLKKVYLPAL